MDKMGRKGLGGPRFAKYVHFGITGGPSKVHKGSMQRGLQEPLVCRHLSTTTASKPGYTTLVLMRRETHDPSLSSSIVENHNAGRVSSGGFVKARANLKSVLCIPRHNASRCPYTPDLPCREFYFRLVFSQWLSASATPEPATTRARPHGCENIECIHGS